MNARHTVLRVSVAAVLASAAMPARALGQTTALYIDSQPGDPISGLSDAETQYTLTLADGPFTVSPNGTGVRISAPGSWELGFWAANNAPLSAGWFHAASFPARAFANGLFVGPGEQLCATETTGWFRVLEVEYDSTGAVTRFAADFEAHCREATPGVFGAIRYNSTISSLMPFDGQYPSYGITITAQPHGTVTGSGIDCGPATTACARSFSSPTGIALTATPDSGYRLLSWSGDCAGGEVALLRVVGPKVCTPVFGPITAPTARSSFMFDSLLKPSTGPSSDPWRGAERRYSDANGVFLVTQTGGGSEVQFLVFGAGANGWGVSFRAPNGAILTPGDYLNARLANTSPSAPGLTFQNSCVDTGRFVVYDASFAQDGTPQSFAADFEADCGGEPTYGAIRYRSGADDVLPFGGAYAAYHLNVVPPLYGRITGGHIACSSVTARGAPEVPSSPTSCVAGLIATASQPLVASAHTGYVFTRWSGACSGTSSSTVVAIDAREVVCEGGFAGFRLDTFSADTALIRPFNVVTWTAFAAPDSGVEYEFWRYDANAGWTLVQPYGPGATYEWTPTGDDVGAHAIQVWARAAGGTQMYDDWRSLSFDVLPELLPVIKTFSADHPYPILAGGTATWTVGVQPGSSAAQFEFWRLDADGWHIVQPYGASPTFTWSPTAADAGRRAMQVWVRNSGSTASYQAWQGTTFDVIIPSLTVTMFAANNAPAIGIATTWTARASGGVAPLQFQFWRLDADGWHMVQDYSTTATYTWTPSPADVGSHALQVWVKSAGSPAAYDAWKGVSFAVPVPPLPSVTIAALGSIPAAGQGSISWKATASGGVAPYQYRFWRLDADGWHIAQDYTASDTYTWSPGVGDSGTHAIQAWVRNAGSSSNYDAWVSTGYFNVSIPPPVGLSFSAAPALPATAGTMLTWTAMTTTPDVEYEVWRYDEGTGWAIVQPYGALPTYAWTTDAGDVGTHALQVWVRRIGSVAAYDGWISSGYFSVIAP